ncbi:MAG: N-acetylneuraminate synthase family protein [Bacteroidales bacterium]|jgi:N-acetylneuraminate synthase|nr:N-acetylneuraminate synthase family protein [Bacteroidales bacterium]
MKTISSLFEDSDEVFIIAEACDNHMGNVDIAKEMCRQAKLAGCNCIKFQHHLPDEEMLKDVPVSSNFSMPLYDFLKLHALTIVQHIELKEFCEDIGIYYLCTPFSLKAAYELNAIGVTAFKIGSGEMTDIPMLLKIAELGKPMIISTGMSTLEEIERTYNALLPANISLAFTNCLSEYPPKYQDINLGVISKMQKLMPNAVIGHSDHTPDLYTCFAAVALGARIIEKHVILDKKTQGPDQTVSIDFADLYHLVDGIRKIELALGDQKKINDDEKPIRKWALRSLVSTKKLYKGDIVKEDMIWSKRPGTGIPSYKMKDILGKKLVRDIEKNTLLNWSDFVN